MNDTAIAWTNVTWNPVSGCEKVSAECKYCYAETLSQRWGAPAFPNGFGLTLRPHKLDEPSKLKEPSLIFVNSMSDLFWDKIPEDYRDKIVDVIEAHPQHEFQVLTKRPEAMHKYSWRRRLPPNFWAGVSVGLRDHLRRVEILIQVRAEIRFVSAEPLLGPLLLSPYLPRLHWVITGGESGLHLKDSGVRDKRALVAFDGRKWTPHERGIQWVRDIREQCAEAGVAFFHKQWGGIKPESGGRLLDGRTHDAFPRLPRGGAVNPRLFDQAHTR